MNTMTKQPQNDIKKWPKDAQDEFIINKTLSITKKKTTQNALKRECHKTIFLELGLKWFDNIIHIKGLRRRY